MLTSTQTYPSLPGGDSDPVLAPYLAAASATETATLLAQLLALQVDPLIAVILRARQSGRDSSYQRADVEDIASATRECIIGQLRALRDEKREPIRDFRAYVASATYTAWAESLRARHPQRALLLKRLRYLLENRTARKGFSLWEDADGAKWCGLAAWTGRPGTRSPKYEWLLVDAAAAARDALGDADPAQLLLPDLVEPILRWLGGPIELRELTTALAELPGVVPTQGSATEIAAAFDPRQSPAEDLIWKEYLDWLWRELANLSDRQRRAFLFHSEVLREFELLGVASIRSVAPLVNLSAIELAELWNQLPLDDLAIAEILGATRQQVINLRRVARDKLGEAWRAWVSGAGNKRSGSPS